MAWQKQQLEWQQKHLGGCTDCTWSPLPWTRKCHSHSCYVHRLIWPVGHLFPQNHPSLKKFNCRHRRKIWILQSFRVILCNWIQREWCQILWSMIYKVLQTCRTDSISASEPCLCQKKGQVCVPRKIWFGGVNVKHDYTTLKIPSGNLT